MKILIGVYCGELSIGFTRLMRCCSLGLLVLAGVMLADVNNGVAAVHKPLADRLNSFSTVGKGMQVLKPGKEALLFERRGSGCITHLWFGGSWSGYDHTRIRIYVDGARKPSIDMQLGMGHGMGWRVNGPWGIATMGQTGSPSGVYDTYKIPYGTSIRITGELAAGIKQTPDFWWIVHDTTGGLPVRIDGVKLPSTARLHLYVQHETVQPLKYFTLCNVAGRGALYQVAMKAKSQGTLNFMEGMIRAYANGAKKAMRISSGLEDFFTGTYYFNRGLFHTPIAGLTYINAAKNEFSGYRFFTHDPFFFQHGLRLTGRCGEPIPGSGGWNHPKTTNYTTYTWVYQW